MFGQESARLSPASHLAGDTGRRFPTLHLDFSIVGPKPVVSGNLCVLGSREETQNYFCFPSNLVFYKYDLLGVL